MKISLTSALVALTGLTAVSIGTANGAIIGNAFTLVATNGSGVDGVVIPQAALVYEPLDNSWRRYDQDMR